MDLHTTEHSELIYQKISQEILISLRGSKTQRQLSEELGFSFNQVGKWESGVTRLKWDEFIYICQKLGLNLEDSISFFCCGAPSFAEDATNEHYWLKTLQLISTLTDQESLPWPKRTIKRWQNGDTAPSLADVLRMLNSRPSLMIGWLAQLIDCSKIPSLSQAYEELVKRIDLVLEDPICVYVNAALQLEVYRQLPVHDEVLLSHHSTCSVEHLRELLQKMLLNDIITFKNGKYYPCPFDFSFSTSRNPKIRTLTHYTTSLAASRYPLLPKQQKPNLILNHARGSVRVCAISKKASAEIQNLIMKFHSDVANVVAHDNDTKTGVQVVLAHTFPSNFNAPD